MKHFIYKILVVFSLFLPMSLTAMAQNVQIEFPLDTKNSLIREYMDNVDIIYNHGLMSSFLYVDRFSSNVVEVQLPIPLEVTDMEIVGDTLYFCGKNNNNNYVCLMDIHGTFFGSSQITVLPIPYNNPTQTVYGITYIGQLELSKLEVQARGFVNAGDLHIYMIGDVNFFSTNATDFSCIIDVRYDGFRWYCDVAYEVGYVYHFNDLTITENYLWVVGDKHEATGEYMHGYDLPNSGSIAVLNTTLSPCFFPSTCYWYIADFNYYPISRQLIETLPGDNVAVACYGMINTHYPEVVVSIYNVGLNVSLIKRLYVPNVTMTDEFRDLKYNPMSDCLFLMPNHNYSGITDRFYRFDLSSYTASLQYSNFPQLHSVDYLHNDIGVVVSGMTSNNHLGEWKLTSTMLECESWSDLQVNSEDGWQTRWDLNIEYSLFDIVPTSVSPILNEFEYDVLCGDPSKHTQR